MKKTDEKLKQGMYQMSKKIIGKALSKCNMHSISNYFHCQREEEMESKCDKQCEHCKEYYKGTDNVLYKMRNDGR